MMPVAGFNFGSVGATPAPGGLAGATSTGFSFGAPPATTTNVGFGATSAAPRLGFELSTTGFGFGGTTSTLSSSGFGIGATTKSTPSFGFGSTTSGLNFPSGGLNFGSSNPSTTIPSLTGFGATSSGPTFGLGATTTSSTLSFFTSNPTLSTASATTGGLTFNVSCTTPSLFSSALTKTTVTGLGGVDPSASTPQSGVSLTGEKSSEIKTVKAAPLDGLIVTTVDNFKKFVKGEKSVREEIARLSCKDMIKIQEDVVNLRNLLNTISSTVRHNTVAVDKLKWETNQELKYSEIALRTKDTPSGLQYENTAPTLYFQHLCDRYDSQIQIYRRQIDTMESHLSSLNSRELTPQELATLLCKLHDTFIVLAAQLHQVHESVNIMKDRYLTYRKVVHGDSKNIFDKNTKPSADNKGSDSGKQVNLLGPNPFTGTTIGPAFNITTLINRRQEQPGLPPAVGLNQPKSLTGGLFGSSGFGTFSSGQTAPTFGGSLFGNSTFNTGNLNNSNTLNFGSSSSSSLFGQSLFGSVENKPFQLQKPPQGAKRGKR